MFVVFEGTFSGFCELSCSKISKLSCVFVGSCCCYRCTGLTMLTKWKCRIEVKVLGRYIETAAFSGVALYHANISSRLPYCGRRHSNRT
jgi:hypothetical protein